MNNSSKESQRLAEAREGKLQWKKWGPYLSERQWGTVREDYSENEDAWGYFTHEQSRSRTYRWGEDGIGGISDDKQQLCFALALWNENDPILKERLFGLTNGEGNHGEDVKECYFYLDSTPTHSYMKFLYKYPQSEFPYTDLVSTNGQRNRLDREYELMDTGVFDDDKYFDVYVEYAKEGPDDILIKISVFNRGKEDASIHVLPTLWFRNYWQADESVKIPELRALKFADGKECIQANPNEEDPNKESYSLYLDGECELLFTNNETNNQVVFGSENSTPYVKDGINSYVVNKADNTINPDKSGTKSSAHYKLNIEAEGKAEIHMRLSSSGHDNVDAFHNFNNIFEQRIKEADQFYEQTIPEAVRHNEEHYQVARQAFAGMLWSKQYYYYDVAKWIKEHGVDPLCSDSKADMRNKSWHHMETEDIISMPDKWEYPWFAAWDLAFHMFPLSVIDLDFAKHQLDIMLRSDYIHPNGQLPAYEWNFSDVNPPVHAWATMQIYLNDKVKANNGGDFEFLQFCFGKLLINFMWWLNRKDPEGNNLFHGGFLGLDNIGVFDRSSELPTGGHIEQADGTAWMAFYSMQMLRMSFELAQTDAYYESYIHKFYTHTMWISAAMGNVGKKDEALWDEEDGFFYDLLHFPDGTTTRLKIRSLVGLLPIMSVCVFPDKIGEQFPNLLGRLQHFHNKYADVLQNVHTPNISGEKGRRMISIVNEDRLRLILKRMLDENEFLSPYGIRSLSLHHKDQPYVFHWGDEDFKVEYLPGESNSSMFGGNSNWRGPVWIPVNVLLINSLLNYYSFFGDNFKIECPTGSGNEMNLLEIVKFISKRIVDMFLKSSDGQRPLHGNETKYKDDPNWNDLILFYEYFNGDTGEGIGASHQTGWTGCVTELIGMIDLVTPDNIERYTHLYTNV